MYVCTYVQLQGEQRQARHADARERDDYERQHGSLAGGTEGAARAGDDAVL